MNTLDKKKNEWKESQFRSLSTLNLTPPTYSDCEKMVERIVNNEELLEPFTVDKLPIQELYSWLNILYNCLAFKREIELTRPIYMEKFIAGLIANKKHSPKNGSNEPQINAAFNLALSEHSRETLKSKYNFNGIIDTMIDILQGFTLQEDKASKKPRWIKFAIVEIFNFLTQSPSLQSSPKTITANMINALFELNDDDIITYNDVRNIIKSTHKELSSE